MKYLQAWQRQLGGNAQLCFLCPWCWWSSTGQAVEGVLLACGGSPFQQMHCSQPSRSGSLAAERSQNVPGCTRDSANRAINYTEVGSVRRQAVAAHHKYPPSTDHVPQCLGKQISLLPPPSMLTAVVTYKSPGFICPNFPVYMVTFFNKDNHFTL